MTPKLSDVSKHYREEAKKYGDSKQSTMKDMHIRDMEVDAIIKGLSNYTYYEVLEVGCGNGYAALEIAKIYNGINTLFHITGIDFCEDMIKIAEKRQLKNMSFEVGNVTKLRFADNSFDVVYSERCLINLATWSRQKKALKEVRRVLKPTGVFLMIEAFTDGLDNLNKAREAMGSEPILMPSFDLYLDKQKLYKYLKGKFTDLKWCPPNFLSTYYFGTRVIYPALIAGKKDLAPNSMFDEFYTHLPPYGNYSPIQMYVLQKVA